MPRWLFLTFVVALGLAVFGSAFIALRGAPSPAAVGKPSAVDKPAAGLVCRPVACPGLASPV